MRRESEELRSGFMRAEQAVLTASNNEPSDDRLLSILPHNRR